MTSGHRERHAAARATRSSCAHLTFTLLFGKTYGAGALVCTCCGKLASEIHPAKATT